MKERMMKTTAKGSDGASESIDGYIAGYPAEVQAILQKVRATIAKAAPNATETISYRMPSFVLDGPLVYFGGFKEHVGFYPPVRDAALKKAAAAYANERGNLRFLYNEPIPYALITKLVKARVAENRAKVAARRSTLRTR
jgi:uncharacterized protein YdhG (YjbR/CyaY superfamily)